MKLLSHLASLSAAAALMLQLGTFVEASPFFTGNTATAHSNAAGTTQQCKGLRFSFPSATGLSFEEHTKHLVAWQAPTSLDKVTLSLVNDVDSSNPINIGTFLAKDGATSELPLDLHGRQPGQYHYHIQSGDCTIDSVGFNVEQQQSTSAPVNGDDQHSNSDESFDKLIQNIKGLASDNNTAAHSNDQAFDDLVSSFSKSNTTPDIVSDQKLNDIVAGLKETQSEHTNDEALDGLVNDLKTQETQHSNDQALDGLVNDLKLVETQHSNDQAFDGLVNNLKSVDTQHPNDEALDNLISQLPGNRKDSNNDLDSLVKDIKSTTKPSGTHQDVALNNDLDSLSSSGATNDDSLDSLVNNIAKSTQNDHQNAEEDTHAWDSMINDLASPKNQKETATQSTRGLEQVIDDLAESIKNAPTNNKDKPHSNAIESPSNPESFDTLINDLDQNPAKYLQYNKESEANQVSHKNDLNPDSAPAPHVNEWFTNTDLRTKTSKRSIVKRGESNYITNGDRHTTHGNEAVPATDPVLTRPVWAVNGGYFTNDDQRSNVNSGIHNDAEWAEDADIAEQVASRPVWAVNGAFFTNDDQRTTVNSGIHNDAEWAEDSVEPVISRPVWAVNGGFFTNDDQRTNVNTGVHNDAEWAEEAAVITQQQDQDGIWHMDEVEDFSEWNIDDDITPQDHENSVWESLEHPDEPSYIANDAPVHHHNDIEWNIHDNNGPILDHTNFVHWDSEDIDAQVESEDDKHQNEAPDGEWVDDDHINDDANLQWAEDTIEDMEDDEHSNGSDEWQTSEHVNDDAINDPASRWSLNGDVTEWNTNTFDENEIGASSINSHVNDASSNDTPQWLSNEHANDDHEDDTEWSVNDGPAEWSVSEDLHSNAAVLHGNDDATATSQWDISEHANDDQEDDNEWSVNDGPVEWSVDEDIHSNAAVLHGNDDTTATSQWDISEHANDDHEDDHEWSVNDGPVEWSVDEDLHSNGASSQWLTSEHKNDDHEDEHLNDSEWNANVAASEWNVNDGAETQHSNAASPQWLTGNTEHSDAGSEYWQVNGGDWATNDVTW